MGTINFTDRLKNNRFLSTWVVFLLDVLASVVSSVLTLLIFLLVSGHDAFSASDQLIWILGALIASLISFRIGQTYRNVIRYSTLRALGGLIKISLGKDLLLWLGMTSFSSLSYTSRLLGGLIIIDLLLTVCALGLIRVLMMAVYDRLKRQSLQEENKHNVLIYGIHDKSVGALSRLRNSSHYDIKGFLTPETSHSGHRLSSMPVYNYVNAKDLNILVKRLNLDGILFSTVKEAREEKDRLIDHCRENKLKCYLIPEVDEIVDNESIGPRVRKVKIEDLLGRDEIQISMNEIIENFHDKTVMVTGAAGSIGSELCRQLATFGVKQLILFDNAETPLHNIRLELEDRFPELNFVPVIGDVRSIPRLDFVFSKYCPQIVFHAAAYKHVPLMEENPCEAVYVNVAGSRQVADKCVEYDVEKMVMVSTDKAVNPTNIMGCTKRLAEIYVQSLGLAIERREIKGKTTFVTTRFGNVLGSNGSVIPRFREQIEHGGPLTVTHPEINRFFMTIPEACRLVMEAATFSTGTQIFVFDMGTPVKIVDLAKRMIHLAGLEEGKDIKIEFTGLRPGEKLYEEVLATKENTIPTTHERIFVAKAREYSNAEASEVMTKLTELATIVEIPEMVKLMKAIVPEFKSKNSQFEKYD